MRWGKSGCCHCKCVLTIDLVVHVEETVSFLLLCIFCHKSVVQALTFIHCVRLKLRLFSFFPFGSSVVPSLIVEKIVVSSIEILWHFYRVSIDHNICGPYPLLSDVCLSLRQYHGLDYYYYSSLEMM